jgi:uncharacterized membrane protein YqjE
MGTVPTQRSFVDVLQDIVGNVQQIIRSEFRLARAELREKANRAAKPATTLAAGAILGFYGLGFLLLAIIYALSIALAMWLAALIVSALLIIISAILVVSGRNKLKQIQPVPEKTVETLKENVQWAKDQMR